MQYKIKTLKYFLNEFRLNYLESEELCTISKLNSYRQGFIDATKLAAENAQTGDMDECGYVDKQSILKVIEE